MTLKLAIQITADAADAKKGVGEARAELAGLKAEATTTERQVEALADALKAEGSAASEAGRDTAAAAAAFGRQEQAASSAANALRQLTAAERAASAAMRGANSNSLNSASAINARLGVRDDFAGAGRAADIAAYGAALDDLRAKYSPLYAAGRTYKATLDEIRQAEKLGAISAREAATQIERVKTAFAAQATLIKAQNTPGASAWSQLRPDQKFSVTRQVPDILQSLALGMSPGQVALQQGPQIVDGLGGMSNTLKVLGGVITPVTVGLGALTAAAVAGAAAWLDYAGRTKEAQVAAQAFGANYGVTAAGIERVAIAASEAGRISVSSAREIATELARTGKLGTDQIGGLVAITKDFAAVMRTDVAGATAKLGDIFGDPAKGAAQLRQLGLIDGATERLVGRLVQQNRTTEAGSVLLAAVTPRLQGAATATTAIGRAAEWAKEKWDNLWNGVGAAVDRLFGGGADSLEGKLAAAQERLSRMDATFQPGDRGYDRRKAARDALVAEIAAIQEQIKVQEAAAKKATEAAAEDRRGTAAVGVADQSPAVAIATQRRQLEADLATLRAGIGTKGLTADETQRITDAIQAKERVLAALNDRQARANELARLDAQIQLERDPVARANLIARRTSLQLSEREISNAELEIEVNTARTRSLAESAAASSEAARGMLDAQRNRLEMLKLEISLIGQSEQARSRAIALLQMEQQIRDQRLGRNSPAAEQLRANAAKEADLQAVQARQQDATQTFTSISERSLDTIASGLVQNAGSWRSWGDIVQDVVGDVAQSILKLAVLNPLKNALLGTNYGTMADVKGAGGLLGSMFGLGGGSSSYTMVTGGAGPYAVPTFAKGGIATGPSIFGEAGPEAAVPLPDGRRIPVDLRGAGSGGGNMQVNVNVENRHSGASVSAGQMTMGPDGVPQLSVIVDMVRTIMADDQASFGPITQGNAARFIQQPGGGGYL